MIARYVRNWYSLLAIYGNLISKTTAQFKNGKEIVVDKENFALFYEELYKQHLERNGFRYETKENTKVWTPNGLVIQFKEVPYSFVLDEIYVMKEYGEPDLKGRTVIDVGASIGDSSLFFATLGASKVYGFEINPGLYQLAQENIKSNKMLEKIQVYNIEATSESLKRLILEHGLSNIFLKIDCEGCEYQIIKNADQEIFDKIKDIVVEYHEKPEPLIYKFMKCGFNISRRGKIIFATNKKTASCYI